MYDRYVIPHVNRATRQLGDGVGLVMDMATLYEATPVSTEIPAASLHKLTWVMWAVHAGADHVTISPDLLEALGDHPHSKQAIEGFDQYV